MFTDVPFHNILVTGAAGFIGSHFVKHLLQQNKSIQIISLDKLTYAGNIHNLRDLPENRHYFIEGDITNSDLIKKLFYDYHIDAIVHFAAESHVDNSIVAPGEFIKTNIVGTFSLVETAKKVWLDERKLPHHARRFHHISTDEVYGELTADDESFNEETAYKPRSPYSASKAGSDHIVKSYFHTYGLPITISNCSNNFGPNQHLEKLIPKVIESCYFSKPIPLYGNGQNIRDWLFVKDHCDAILTILAKGKIGETYNIGGQHELDNLSLVKLICKLIDNLRPIATPYSDLIQFVEDRKGHDFRYAINNEKIFKALDWHPKTNFLDALEETIKFYLDYFLTHHW